MNDRIRTHVDELFMGVPHTRQAADIKEELLANLQAKYEDLISRDIDPDEAFNNVISGIGDIQGLLGTEQIEQVENAQVNRQRSSILKGIAIVLFICSIIPPIIFNEYVPVLETLGVMSMLLMIAGGVGILVYAVSISPKKYQKGDDTFVEEYKEKVTGGDKQQRLRNAVSSTLWLMIVIIYLASSFITHKWHVTWLIFLAGGLIQNIILYAMGDPKRQKNLISSAIWTSAVIIYFVIGFWTWHWFWGAFVFLAAALIQQLIRLFHIWKEG